MRLIYFPGFRSNTGLLAILVLYAAKYRTGQADVIMNESRKYKKNFIYTFGGFIYRRGHCMDSYLWHAFRPLPLPIIYDAKTVLFKIFTCFYSCLRMEPAIYTSTFVYFFRQPQCSARFFSVFMVYHH